MFQWLWQEKRVLIISTKSHAGPRRRNVPWALIWFLRSATQTGQTLHMCVCVFIRWKDAWKWLSCTHVCGCGQHMGSIPRVRGTENIRPLTLTSLINADHSAAILEPFRGEKEKKKYISKSHTFHSKSQFSFKSHLLSRTSAKPICGSTADSQLNWSLDRWCSPQVHLKSNERKVEWDYTHKALHRRWPREKVEKVRGRMWGLRGVKGEGREEKEKLETLTQSKSSTFSRVGWKDWNANLIFVRLI